MESVDINKYLDPRGREVMAHAFRLRQLGLVVDKTFFAHMTEPGSAAVFGMYDLKFRKSSEKFSPELTEFLKNTVKLSDADVAWLEKEAVLSPEEFKYDMPPSVG